MNRKLEALSRRYLAALRNHLEQKPEAGLKLARGLGEKSVALGLDTLDLARVHQRALGFIEAGQSRDGVIKKAELFFTETLAPIEETHRVAIKSNERLKRLTETLKRRTSELTVAANSLKEGIARRKAAELALEKSGQHYQTLLDDSLALQKRLQTIAHRILSAEEHNRGKTSHALQNEIAQTLLAINVRLLGVKEAVGRSARIVQEEVLRTSRLVDLSMKTIERFVRECSNYNAK